jgi:hypothetical protein
VNDDGRMIHVKHPSPRQTRSKIDSRETPQRTTGTVKGNISALKIQRQFFARGRATAS